MLLGPHIAEACTCVIKAPNVRVVIVGLQNVWRHIKCLHDVRASGCRAAIVQHGLSNLVKGAIPASRSWWSRQS
jgi:hypothetical protein